MKKVAVVTDSTAYIPKEIRKEKNITMVPLNVIIGEESYQEEIDLTTEQFYEEMKMTENLPKTSQPAIGTFEETFEELAKSHDEVIVITLSSGISGTYQTAVTAASTVEGLNIHVFDSEISCMVQGFYALKAAEMAAEGKNVEEIYAQLEVMKMNCRAYFMADDLSHLHRGGRLNGAQLIMGSLLQIKPVLHFENKLIVPFEKVRTEKKAMGRIYSLLDEDARDGTPLDITVIHANREEKAKKIIEELQEKYPSCHFILSYFGPVIGTHLGEGSLGIGWVKK